MNRIVCTLAILVLFSSCSDNSVLAPRIAYIESNIHLQMGFSNHRVIMYIDSLRAFDAALKNESPLAGPEASFITYLRQGEHQLVTLLIDSTAWIDTTRFSLGLADRYFIGLQAVPDSMIMVIQDYPFIYL